MKRNAIFSSLFSNDDEDDGTAVSEAIERAKALSGCVMTVCAIVPAYPNELMPATSLSSSV